MNCLNEGGRGGHETDGRGSPADGGGVRAAPQGGRLADVVTIEDGS